MFGLVFPHISVAADNAVPPGCTVPRGYDCATPGFERPLSLDQAKALSLRGNVVYLYGPGLQDARIVAKIMSEGRGEPPIPAIAAPGLTVPEGATYVVAKGKVLKHRVSGKPVEFYQRFLNRGKLFNLTRQIANQGN